MELFWASGIFLIKKIIIPQVSSGQVHTRQGTGDPLEFKKFLALESYARTPTNPNPFREGKCFHTIYIYYASFTII
jgi:hypothetical protein